MVGKGRLKFHKILGKDNLADLYAKYLDEKTNHYHTNNLAYKFRDGEAQEAFKLHAINHSREDWEYGGNFEESEEVGRMLSIVRRVGEKKTSQWGQLPGGIQHDTANPLSQQIHVLEIEIRRINQEITITTRRVNGSRQNFEKNTSPSSSPSPSENTQRCKGQHDNSWNICNIK